MSQPPAPVPGVDPSRVSTPTQLAVCLDGLRLRRGLSYEAMDRIAQNLPRRQDGPAWESLGKSTVGEIVTGKRLPSRGKLLTFLAVCQVSGPDVAQWLAAWERARTADLSSGDAPDGSEPSPQDHRLGDYLRRIQEYYRQLNLEMLLTMTNVEERLRVPLQEVFTPPLARADPPAVELPREFRRRLLLGEEADPRGMPRDLESEVLGPALTDQWQPPRPVLGLIAGPDHRHLVLLGDPGSGKSTIARYLVLRLAELHTSVLTGHSDIAAVDPLPALAGALPLLVELRLYSATGLTSVVDFIDQLHHAQGLGLPASVLRPYLEGGRPAVVVFDGLDEVFDRDRRNSVCREIREFARRYPNTRTVVTSRPVGYHRQTLDDAGFELYQLQDLDVGQISSFVTAWYEIACADDRAEGERLRGRLVSAVGSSPAVHELAGNPLLLTLLCIMGRRRELPRDRVHVYEFAVSLLVEHWDVEAHSFPNQEGLLYDDKLDLLRILARTMLLGKAGIGGNRITEQDLQAAFESYLRDERGYQRPVARTAAHSMIDQLRTRNYILSRFGAGMYGFVHRAFLEYLAALDIVHQFDNRFTDEADLLALFEEHGADPAWSEVLLLVVRMKERFAAAIISRLLTADQAWRFDEAHLPAGSLLAIRALHEVRPSVRLAAQVDAVMARIFELLLMLEANPDGALQAALQEAALPTFTALGHRWFGARLFRSWYAGAGPSLSGPVARLAARLNAPLGNETELTRDMRLHHDPLIRATAAEVLAEHRDRDATAFEQLVRRAATDPAGEVRRTCISALASRWWDEPTVRSLLEQRAEADPEPIVRRACVELLHGMWPSRPEFRTLVLRRAELDTDPRVRAAAVSVLSDGFGVDPDVDALVRGLLQGDTDALVRRASVEGIVAAAHGNAESLALIVACATEDPHRAVRQAAVRALSVLAVGGADVRSVLAGRSVDDGDAGVRKAALEGMVTAWPGAGHTRDLLIGRAVGDAHWTVRGAALKSLAGIWSHHPGTLPLLVERATEDDDEDVRIAALLGASSPLVDYPDAYDLLLTAYATDPSPSVRQAIVTMLADAEHDEAATRASLLQWGIDDVDWAVRAHVIATLGLRWPDDTAVREAVLARAAEDHDEDVRRAALSCVARNWSDLPETHRVIVDLAESDNSDIVRRAALGCLASGWRDDPNTQRVLQAHAADDPEESIRRAALRALAATRPSHPGVRQLVAVASEQDPDWAVRQTSLLLLTQAWPGHAETVPLVLYRSMHDQSVGVRQSAVQALAVGHPPDPRVVAGLEALARTDAAASVRGAALRGLAAGCGTTSETFRLAADLAVDDQHAVVRLTAVETLGYFWPDSIDTRPLVERCANDDPDATVRRVAAEVITLAWG
ncbi:HEAT repeat domain-containing protein [Streptomyces sp. NPDC094447]|uniref:HEAT repeat domain-containing protein n=1 Tax=Streptomyces sp. NPDC094447 TaxID=3366062 RepID=UPI0038177505